MFIHIPEYLMGELIRHAESVFPNECCGILVGRVADEETCVERVIQASNITEDDPKQSYQLDWRTLFETVRETRDSSEEIVGFYHSHPDGTDQPSRRDEELAWLDHVYLILRLEPQIVRPVVPADQKAGCHASRERGSMFERAQVTPVHQDAPYGTDPRVTAWKTVQKGSPMQSVAVMIT